MSRCDFPVPVGPDEHGAGVLGHEVAVEQPQDGLLGNPLGEGEVVLLQGLAWRQPGPLDASLQGPVVADGGFFADQGGQHVEHGILLAGRLVEHFLVELGDAVELQLRQIAQQFLVALWAGVLMGGSSSSEVPNSRS